MPNNKIYLVEWEDAFSNDGWQSDTEVKNLIEKEKCITINVGWILHEDKDYIVIASRKLKWESPEMCKWGLIQKIPKGWIRKRMIYKNGK